MITSPDTSNIEKLTETLVSYSIDRSEMNALLNCVSLDTKLNRTAIEYEIQIVRIIGVGWSINYYVQDNLLKHALSESYWNSIQELSNNISAISSVSINQEFNYFQIIKQRLDTYLKEFNLNTNADQPTAVIGPKFAMLCGHPKDPVAEWLGNKMFQSVLNTINTCLSNAKFVENNYSQNT